jgi:hypothetical protein
MVTVLIITPLAEIIIIFIPSISIIPLLSKLIPIPMNTLLKSTSVMYTLSTTNSSTLVLTHLAELKMEVKGLIL